MMGWWDGILGAAIAATCGCCCALAQDGGSAIVCGGETVVNATVSHIIDGRTFVLNDGREVRLAAIEVPPLPSPGQSARAPDKSGQMAASERDAAAEHEGKAAKDALDALIGGDQVVLRQADISLPNNLDRYGRVVAYAYAQRDGEELFAQGALLESGFARVADRIGNKGCAAELLAGENTARTAKLGLWGDPYYDVLNADAPVDVLAQRGRFALVEGQVVSVRESGATIYMNFGRQWSESFAVTISKRNERSFTAAGLDLKSLAGRRVRVRGFVEARGADGNVPWMEAARPEQIEVADQD
ncbi:MAG TPA: thermonuclease family protein [Xanthobacteraceae bacterium]|jgi:endonuclease YncB( thermonuclease family)|nr:thermonuclease family protein [Xanthobacteraceae bacterium]